MDSHGLADLTHCFHLGAQSVESQPAAKLSKTKPKQNWGVFLRRNFSDPMGNDTYRVFLLFVFVLAWFPVADKIMQGAVLHQSREDKDEANRHKEIHRCDIGDLGE